MAGSGEGNEQLDRDALREELVRLRADASRLRLHVDELEHLRSRANGEAGDLRTELQKRNDAYRDLNRRHDELKALFGLASDQLDGVAERGTLQWLRPSESEARGRIIAAERSMHEFLVGCSDDVASIADKPGTSLFVGERRERVAAILEQLELAHDELAVVTERLARHELNPARRFLLRIITSRMFRRIRLAVSSR